MKISGRRYEIHHRANECFRRSRYRLFLNHWSKGRQSKKHETSKKKEVGFFFNPTCTDLEEVEQLAIKAAERVAELKEQAAQVLAKLTETADAVAMGRLRARRLLSQFDTTLSRSTGDQGLHLRFASYSRIGHREMRALAEVQVAVFVD